MSKPQRTETGAQPIGPGLLPLRVRKVRTVVRRHTSEWIARSMLRLPAEVPGWTVVDTVIGQLVTAAARGTADRDEDDDEPWGELLIETRFTDPPPGGVPIGDLSEYLRTALPPLVERAFSSTGELVRAEADGGRPPWGLSLEVTYRPYSKAKRAKDLGPLAPLTTLLLVAHSKQEPYQRRHVSPTDEPWAKRLVEAADESLHEYVSTSASLHLYDSAAFLAEAGLAGGALTGDDLEMAYWSVRDLCVVLTRAARNDEGVPQLLEDEYVRVRVTYNPVTFPDGQGTIALVQPPVDQPPRTNEPVDTGRLVMPAPEVGTEVPDRPDVVPAPRVVSLTMLRQEMKNARVQSGLSLEQLGRRMLELLDTPASEITPRKAVNKASWLLNSSPNPTWEELWAFECATGAALRVHGVAVTSPLRTEPLQSPTIREGRGDTSSSEQ